MSARTVLALALLTASIWIAGTHRMRRDARSIDLAPDVPQPVMIGDSPEPFPTRR